MDPRKFIEPKEIEILGSKFILSKIPAIQAQQIYRAIMQECKVDGDVAMTYLTEPTTVSLLSYAASVEEGEGSEPEWKALDGAPQINFACKRIDVLINLEAAMIRYNFGFLFNGSLPKVLDMLREGMAI